MDLLVKPIDFNKEGTLIFEIAFMNEDVYESLCNMKANGKLMKIKLKSSAPLNEDQRISYKMQQKWFVLVNKILEHHNVFPTAENVDALSDQLKKQYLPVDKIIIGGQEIIKVRSISYQASEENAITIRQFNKGIEKLIEDYTRLGVDFEQA